MFTFLKAQITRFIFAQQCTIIFIANIKVININIIFTFVQRMRA